MLPTAPSPHLILYRQLFHLSLVDVSKLENNSVKTYDWNPIGIKNSGKFPTDCLDVTQEFKEMDS
jgi:hypothetical protein